MNFPEQTSHRANELVIPYIEGVDTALCEKWIDTFFGKLERRSILGFRNLHGVWVSSIEPKFRQFFEKQPEIIRVMRANFRTHPDIVFDYQSDLEAVELIYVALRNCLHTKIKQHYTSANTILAIVPDFITCLLFERTRQEKKLKYKYS